MVPFPKCYGLSLSITKLTLNEPAITENEQHTGICITLHKVQKIRVILRGSENTFSLLQ